MPTWKLSRKSQSTYTSETCCRSLQRQASLFCTTKPGTLSAVTFCSGTKALSREQPLPPRVWENRKHRAVNSVNSSTWEKSSLQLENRSPSLLRNGRLPRASENQGTFKSSYLVFPHPYSIPLQRPQLWALDVAKTCL